MQIQILVIEDDEILNSGLCYNLQKRGITPFSAYCVEEAKSLLLRISFTTLHTPLSLLPANHH